MSQQPQPEVNIPENATCVEDFGYKFNEQGQLRNIETGDKFKFLNQKHYDALGDVVLAQIQRMMQQEPYNLTEVLLPIGETDHKKANNIFLSKNALTTEGTLLLVIQGSGAVRAGQWARALCINDSLETGTIFPYLRKAKENNYECIVFNPNLNKSEYKDENGDPIPIQYNERPEDHTIYVWDNFVAKSKARDILIVAHSYGGVCTMALLSARGQQVLDRVRCIAFTDSVHTLRNHKLDESALNFLYEHACNWVQSDKPLDTFISDNSEGCLAVSAGNTKHEYTSASAIESVFKYFQKHLAGATNHSSSSDNNNTANTNNSTATNFVSSAQPTGKSTIPMPKTAQDKIAVAARLKEEGNRLLKEGQYKKAIGQYKRVFLYITGLNPKENAFVAAVSQGAMQKPSDAQEKEIAELSKSVNSNLVLAYFKLQEYDKVLQYTNKVLAVDQNNVKALFRRGQVYLIKRDVDRARADLTKAQSLAPTDTAIQAELKKLQQVEAQIKSKEKKIYAGMFDKI